MVAKKR
jgi:hypothetical protein